MKEQTDLEHKLRNKTYRLSELFDAGRSDCCGAKLLLQPGPQDKHYFICKSCRKECEVQNV